MIVKHGGLALILVLYLAITLVHLNSWPPVRYDESWIGSVAEQLASEWRFATPLFGDFLALDRLSLDRFPVHSLIQALFVTILGFGIWQLRLPSVLLGRAMLLAFYAIVQPWMGRRWAIAGTAVLAFAPLAFTEPVWAPGITAASTSGRHDITVACFATWSIWAWLKSRERSSLRHSLTAWALAGLAVLTHPYALVFPAMFVQDALIQYGTSGAWREGLRRHMTGGGLFALVVAPWGALLAYHWELARRQFAAFNGAGAMGASLGRFSFFELEFYLGNLAREPERYRKIWESAAAGVVPGVLWMLAALGLGLAWRRSSRDWRARFLAVSLTVGSFLLAAFESWKYSQT